MWKAIHGQEDKAAALYKSPALAQTLRKMKLSEAGKKVENLAEETPCYMDFPEEHWSTIRSNKAIERLNREIRRPTRVLGVFLTVISHACWFAFDSLISKAAMGLEEIYAHQPS